MEVTSKVDYSIHASLSQTEMNGLLDELEKVFVAFVADNRQNEIERLTEFKNLLTLSVNNNY